MVNPIEKKTSTIYLLNLDVKPNSNKQEILLEQEYIKVFIKSKAIHNKANIELLKLLRKKVNVPANQIKIISGMKSIHKTIQIDFEREINIQELQTLLGS